jgi:hypothetical protein
VEDDVPLQHQVKQQQQQQQQQRQLAAVASSPPTGCAGAGHRVSTAAVGGRILTDSHLHGYGEVSEHRHSLSIASHPPCCFRRSG